MKSLTKLLALAALAAAAFSAQAQYAQVQPVYQPDAIVAVTTVSATGTAAQYPVNSQEAVYIRVGGAPSAANISVQVTESRASSPAWTTRAVTNMATGAQQSAITAVGLYRLNAAGLGQLRVYTNSITGTFTVAISGGSGSVISQAAPAQRNTFVSATASFVAAAAATDIMQLVGNASNTVRLVSASCSGQGSATSAITLDLVKRSAASTGGTSTTLAATPLDSGTTAATSAARVYTANPTPGTLLGLLGSQRFVASTDATPTNAGDAVWRFGSSMDSFAQQVTLRGVAESLAINARGATLTNGTTLNCAMVWSEE